MKQEFVNLKSTLGIFLLAVTLAIAGGLPAIARTPGNNGEMTAGVVWSQAEGDTYQVYQSSYANGSWSARQKLTDNALLNTTPVVDAGDDGVVWVVWSGVSGATSALYYAVFDGRSWSGPLKIPSPFSWNTSPSLMIDENNVPWLVWAAFDGQDDDIFFSFWNGTGWEPPSRVNRNDDEPDILPVIWEDADGSVRVKWSGFEENKDRDFVCVWSDGGWSKEKETSEKAYEKFLKTASDRVPVLPEFVKNPALAAVYVHMNGEKNAFRMRDMEDALRTESGERALEPTEALAAGENTIIGYGDSITQGVPFVNSYGNGRRVGGYEPYLEALTRSAGWQTQVLNYGVGGESSRGGYRRLRSVLGAHSAKYILIMEGTNDLLYYGISPSSTLRYLSAMIDISRKYDVLPILSTLTPDTKNSGKNIEGDYNPQIIRLTSEKKIPLADQYKAVASKWYSLTYDGLHPNDAGYKVMADTWFDAMPEITVTTLDATDVTDSSAVFNGTVNPHGYPTKCYFEYGYDTSFGGMTYIADVGSGNSDVPVSIGVDGISENSTYVFRLVAYNDYATVKGATLSLTTPEGPSGNCFIATAAFGSPFEKHVATLRKFRDRFLLTNTPGKGLVRFYYRHSPPLAHYISKHETLRSLVRGALSPVVWLSSLALQDHFRVIGVAAGIFLAGLLGIGIFFRRKRSDPS